MRGSAAISVWPPRVSRPSSVKRLSARGRRIRICGSRWMMEIAQDGSADYDEKGGLRKEHVMRSKLAVESVQ